MPLLSLSRRRFLESLVVGGLLATSPGLMLRLCAAGAASSGLADLAGRRRKMLDYCARARVGEGYDSFYSQIGRLELGQPIDEAPFRVAMAFVDKRGDCSDFCVAGFLRILYRYGQSPRLLPALKEEIETCLVNFKYWWDESGVDDRSYDTENHQIIYHSDQFLAGQLFPDRVFKNSGRTGREQMAFAEPLIRRWLDWRVRFGFSEWLSNCYFEENLLALTNLRDFAVAEDIRTQAEMLIDVVLFELALHSYRGTFGATHGRTYASQIKGGRHEGTSAISWLMFGLGSLNNSANTGAIALATSGYACPPVIEAVAHDFNRTILCRERQSLNVEDAAKFGLSTRSEDDLMLFRGTQDFTNYETLDIAEQVSVKYHLRNPKRYAPWRAVYAKQIAASGRITDPWLCPNALGEVHIATLRTPDYMLSCAQDYRAGIGGYQQHIWQATLGEEAVVFTNHPGSLDEGIHSRPNFWAGNGIKPRAAQHRNVLICLHRCPADDKLPYSHAYFPVAAFDEVTERGTWTFARKADGYLALYSQNPASWQSVASPTRNEWRATAPDNVWICELGSRTEYASFDKFVAAVAGSSVGHGEGGVRYRSPSLGEISFGWSEPLRVAGAEIPLHNYPRFDNPYCQSQLLDRRIRIQRGGQGLDLDFAANQRLVTGPA